MNATEIKKELHEYIEEADDRLLNLVYGLFLVDRQSSYEIPEWHREIIEERLEKYESNPENSISWDDLKSEIEKMK